MSEIEKILNELERLAKQGTITIKEYDDHIETLEYGKLEELRLNNYSAKLLLNYIQQKENIIKEVRKYIDYYGITPEQNDIPIVRSILKGILDILDKGGKVDVFSLG